jgi:gamma-glutamylcyclotransferase (GGCT)/AIG2-like uncharacterized protein YtfP
MALYFAYGSNLHWPQMQDRCPSARFICRAKLPEHKLQYTRYSSTRKGGVADIVVDPTHDVWGVVYEINASDLANLDSHEGFRTGKPRDQNAYVREERQVYREGTAEDQLTVWLYVAIPQKGGPFPPHPDYKRLIVDGAQHWDLPDEYRTQL